jgi:hypothetical protein
LAAQAVEGDQRGKGQGNVKPLLKFQIASPANRPIEPQPGTVWSSWSRTSAAVVRARPAHAIGAAALYDRINTSAGNAVPLRPVTWSPAIPGRGKWAEWVTENCHFSDRTARDYMRMAEHKKQIGRDLPISICGALAKLAKPKPKAKKTRKRESRIRNRKTNRSLHYRRMIIGTQKRMSPQRAAP